MTKKVALLSGITGQDGSFLAELLLEKGYEVHGIIRRSSSFNTGRIDHIFDKLNLHHGDLTDSSNLVRIVKDTQPDEIYNLGAQSHVAVSFEMPEYTAQVDALGTLRMLEAVRLLGLENKTRFYQASTSELYGLVQETPQTEKTPFYPRSPYGCFPADTKILSNVQGKLKNKSIQEIKIGDEVLSFNEKTHVKEYDKVVDVMVRENKVLYKIKFSNGNEVVCTEEHPFYIPNNGWVEAKNLSVNNECIQYKYSGLNKRIDNLRNKGKSLEQIYGEEKAKEIVKKQSEGLKNKNVFVYDKHGNKIMRKNNTYETIYGEEKAKEIKEKNPGFTGPHSQESKNKMSVSKMGNIPWNKDKTWEELFSPEKIEEMKLFYQSEKFRNSLPSKEFLSEISTELWKDLEYVKKQAQAKMKKNKLETKFEEILNEIFPGEFEYNGRLEKDVMIRRKIPDFVNVNGKNKIIEVFGDYWHSLPDKTSEDDLKNLYLEEGYDCCVVWEKELKNKEKLVEKLRNFFYNPNTEIVKIISIEKFEEEGKVYNITTEKNHNYFAHGILVHNCAKIYGFWIVKNYREAYNLHASSGILFNHESSRRGETFVTRKITRAFSKISTGQQDCLYLGNLNAKRDWGHAKDYVEAMWLMLQQEKPDDYVIATGEQYSVRDFVNEAAPYFGMNIVWEGEGLDEVGIDKTRNKVVVRVNARYFRPAEVDSLLGDASKAHRVLGWKPKHTFKQLVEEMCIYGQ